MPTYRYTATDATGHRLNDEIQALGPEQANAYLESVGLKVESLTLVESEVEVEVEEENEVKVERNGSSEPVPLSAAVRTSQGPVRLSSHDVAEFTRHITALSQAGLPLAAGLRALSSELASGPLRRVLASVAEQLEAGQSLEEAIDSQGENFPAHLRGLVLAGIRSGKLGEVLEQFTHYYHVGIELRRKLWLSLAYPFMLVAVMVALFVFVSMVIVNQFVVIYKDFGIDLPGVTRLVISISHVFTDAGAGLLMGLFAVLGVIWLIGMTLGGASWRRSLTCRIPLVGPLWRWTALVEFTHLLALLLESNVPLPTALQLTGEGLRDADIAAACQTMRQEVESGHTLADGIAHIPQFPFGLPRILRWAEAHHSLPGALHLAGEMYEARALAQARFVSVACTAMAVVFVLWGISIMVIGLFQPLIQLISKLSG
ncbi:MAG TPA: type II secretion system F family protein [Isosphaeraceae bacterium]|jgi:general secretion pathway protein F|nr:type II secretion system F family protein [Isosphaeraceae bacterium]